MTENDLQKLGYTKSDDGSWPRAGTVDTGIRHAEPERDAWLWPLGKKADKGRSPRRIHVSIESYRRRLLDPDNLAGGCKAILDCLRRCDAIPDDRPEDITLETSQQKVAKENACGTKIVLVVR